MNKIKFFRFWAYDYLDKIKLGKVFRTLAVLLLIAAIPVPIISTVGFLSLAAYLFIFVLCVIFAQNPNKYN